MTRHAVPHTRPERTASRVRVLEDVEVLGIKVFRMRMSDMRREHRGETSMMVFGQPQREDIEFVIAGEHGIEGGEIAKRLLHHLSPGIDEDPMHGGGQCLVAAPRCGRPRASEVRTRPEPSCRATEMTSLRSSTFVVGGLGSGTCVK